MRKILSIFSVLLLAGSLWAADVTVTKTAAEVAADNGWTTKGTYDSFVLDGIVTFAAVQPASGDQNGYYSADTPNDWRIYQARNKGTFTISAKAGYVIKSINLTYGTKNATDVIARVSGSNIQNSQQIKSGTTYLVNASSMTLYAANCSTLTNAQARISSFTVTYAKADSFVEEAFSQVTQTGSAPADTKWAGDYAQWNVNVVRRKNTDTLACGGQATWFNIATPVASLQTTNAEGGVKNIAFQWSQWGAETDASMKISVSVEGESKEGTVTGVASAKGAYMQYFNWDVNCEKNAQITITNNSTKGTAGTGRIVFADLLITPYLLYTIKEADAYMKDGAFTNTALINNTTGAAVEYTLEDNDGEATINGATGAVTVLTNGQVTVKATWGQVSTTYTLNLHAQSEPEMSFAKDEIRTILGGSVANALSKKTDATPQYESSNTAVAEVDANGAITIKNVGQTKITATCEATDSYKAGEASYELIVRAGGNTLKESFGQVTGATSSPGTNVNDWTGDLFDWQVTGTIRRGEKDTIWNKQGTWIGTSTAEKGGAGTLRSKEAVEGGIKYISFFWKQWATENDGRTLRLNIYAGEDSVTCVEHVALHPIPNQRWYFAASDLMKANKQLIIKNASRYANGTLTTENSRVIVDTIEITPYLLYTLKIDTLDISESTTYTNTNLIDNRDNANAIAYSILEGPATINGDVVTATAIGTVIVQAKWDNVTTTYTLVVKNSSQHQLTWNADGGELTGGTEAGLVTAGTALTAPTATKVGYKHTGWDPEVPEVMPNNDFTSTAQYTAKKCNITLKCNYEGGEEDIEFVATFGQPSPKDGQTLFTRTGYSINKGYWKDPVTEAGGTRLLNTTGRFTTDVNGYTSGQNWARDAEEDITLYAHWKLDTFKITYANMEGATNFEGAPEEYTVETPTITLGTPTKTGYTFAGWKANDAEGEAITEIAKGSTGKKTLWATWTPKKCNITLKCNYEGGEEDIVFVATYGEESPISEVHARENYTMYRGYWMDPVTEGKGTRLVNPTGKFTTGVNGYTDDDQKWIRDAEEDITLYAHWTLATLVLNEGADNSAMLSEADGKTVNVTMTRSALVANVWNSLCLPFAIAKTDLGEAQVVEMTGAEMEGDVINVTFADFNSDTLVAATPYLVKPTAAVELTSFDDKKIDATPKTIGDNGLIQLVGIYSPFALTANDKSKLFLGQPDGQGNNLFFANQDGSLKGMRAYFNIVNAGAQASARVGRMVINQTNIPTQIETPSLAGEGWGEAQKVIINGQLIIIRDGVMYNAMGERL